MITASIILSLLAAITAIWYLNLKYWDKYLHKFSGPTPLPIIGNLLHFTTTHDILTNFNKFSRFYENVFKVSVVMTRPFLVISDVKFVDFLLGSAKLIEKADDYSPMHSWLGMGLITSGGAKWRKHRKIITPTFHFKILEQFNDIFDHYGNILVKTLEKEVGKKSTDIYPYISLVALDIICASAMGTNVNAQEDSDSEYIRSVKEMCRIIIERSFSVFKQFDFFYQFTQDYRIEKKCLDILHGYTNSVIKSRSAELKQIKDEFVYETEWKKKKSFLDFLLDCKDQYELTNEDIRKEVDTFMFAGHDTTSTAVTFCLYCLSINPDLQNKVMEELETIFAENLHRAATYTDLQKMKYLEKVIKESLRLYPSVPNFGRTLQEDVKYDGNVLPKNLTIYVNVMAVHTNPNIYPDPEQFDPERFSSENQSKRSAYSYIPFSAGPRNCIGQKFAMLEMKAVLSKLLKCYEILPSEPKAELFLVTEVILKSKNGVHVQLKKRTLL